MEDLTGQWRKLMKGLRNAAYRNSESAAKLQAMKMCGMLADEIDIYGKGVAGMTGNAAAGVAVGAYRDGNLLGYATVGDYLSKPPIRSILKKGEVFRKGRIRWDGVPQDPTGTSNNKKRFYADKKAIELIQTVHMPFPGFSFLVVSMVPYGKYIEGRGGNLITQLYAELKQMGAKKIFFYRD